MLIDSKYYDGGFFSITHSGSTKIGTYTISNIIINDAGNHNLEVYILGGQWSRTVDAKKI
jgi:hypothetical protein